MIEKHIHVIDVNPFLGGLIFQAFYKGYEGEECSVLIHYLILPMVMYSEMREVLCKLTKRHSLESVIKNNRISFLGLQERIWSMRHLTNLTLTNLSSQNNIIFGEKVEILNRLNYSGSNESIREYLKAAYYLGVLFKSEKIPDIFKHLKVIP